MGMPFDAFRKHPRFHLLFLYWQSEDAMRFILNDTFWFLLTKKVQTIELNENAYLTCRTSESISKENLFVRYEMWRYNFKSDIFVKYVTEVYF